MINANTAQTRSDVVEQKKSEEIVANHLNYLQKKVDNAIEHNNRYVSDYHRKSDGQFLSHSERDLVDKMLTELGYTLHPEEDGDYREPMDYGSPAKFSW
jgi:hypothetical protein